MPPGPRGRFFATVLIVLFVVGCMVYAAVVNASTHYVDEQRWSASPLLTQQPPPRYAPIQLAALTPPLRLSIFYNVYVAAAFPRWRKLVASQLADLARFGLLAQADQLVVCVQASERDAFAGLLHDAVALVRQLAPRSHVLPSAGNLYEWPALYQLWHAAQETPAGTAAHQHLMLYMHTKGLTSGREFVRSPEELALMATVVEPWPLLVELLAARSGVRRVGMAALNGAIWDNFFWVRASAVRELVPPVVTRERYYYEHWLGALRPDVRNGTVAQSRIHTNDGSVHLVGCDDAVSLYCSLAGAEPQLAFVFGLCTPLADMASWQAHADGWHADRLPSCAEAVDAETVLERTARTQPAGTLVR